MLPGHPHSWLSRWLHVEGTVGTMWHRQCTPKKDLNGLWTFRSLLCSQLITCSIWACFSSEIIFFNCLYPDFDSSVQESTDSWFWHESPSTVGSLFWGGLVYPDTYSILSHHLIYNLDLWVIWFPPGHPGFLISIQLYNVTAAAYLNHQGGTRSPVMKGRKESVWAELQIPALFNFYVPGVDNWHADCLSCQSLDLLHSEVFQNLCHRWMWIPCHTIACQTHCLVYYIGCRKQSKCNIYICLLLFTL